MYLGGHATESPLLLSFIFFLFLFCSCGILNHMRRLFVVLFICLSGLCKALQWGERKEGTTQGSRLSPGLLPLHHPLLSQAANIITASLALGSYLRGFSVSLSLDFDVCREPAAFGVFVCRSGIIFRQECQEGECSGLLMFKLCSRAWGSVELNSVNLECVSRLFGCFQLFSVVQIFATIVYKCKCQISNWIFILSSHSYGS